MSSLIFFQHQKKHSGLSFYKINMKSRVILVKQLLALRKTPRVFFMELEN
jgi:hypothetical protein